MQSLNYAYKLKNALWHKYRISDGLLSIADDNLHEGEGSTDSEKWLPLSWATEVIRKKADLALFSQLWHICCTNNLALV